MKTSASVSDAGGTLETEDVLPQIDWAPLAVLMLSLAMWALVWLCLWGIVDLLQAFE